MSTLHHRAGERRPSRSDSARCAADLIVTATGLDFSGVALFDTSGWLCMQAAARHRGPAWNDLVVRPGDGLASRVVKERRPVAIGDYAIESGASQQLIEVWRHEGAFGMVAIPIEQEGTIIGVAYGGLRCRGDIGDRAQLALERVARLYAATRPRASGDPRPTEASSGVRADNPLKPRELQMIRHLSRGASTRDIAASEYLSVNSVRTYVQSALWKLGAHNRLQAVALARESGLL